MKTIFTALATAILLTGCATNFKLDQSKANDFAWVKETHSWKIASDYYTLKHRHPGTVHTTGYFYPNIKSVDPRLLDYYADALERKGYSPAQIAAFGKTHISENMPDDMLSEWIADTPPEFIASDLLKLTGYTSRLRPSHPKQEFYGLPGRYSMNTEASAKLCLKALIQMGWTDECLKSLMDGKLCIGMPEAGGFALWGKPLDTIEHTSSIGVSRQYQYGGIYATSTGVNNTLRYIHSLNGKITSWTKY